MDYQSWIEGINGWASLYAFDILPDGSYSEIRLMAVNKMNELMLHMTPDAPEFYPGIPYRNYWMDLNFEAFVYKCAGTPSPLYSYVNARGGWLKGFYLPIADIWDNVPETDSPEGSRTVYCLYILTYSDVVETESMINKSTEVINAVLEIGIKLHVTQNLFTGLSSITTIIKDLCSAEMCSLYTVDPATRDCFLVDQNGLQIDFMHKIASEMGRSPYDVAKAMEECLAMSDCLLLNNLSVIEERDPVWYKSLTSYGVKNMILYAIQYNQIIVGYIWAANYDTDKTDRIKETLELSTFIIASVIVNYQLLYQLEYKSTTDILTKVNNRNALSDYINSIKEGQEELPPSMGVIFADLNGLKKTNDEKGHDAGDKLLIRAASLIKIVFGDYQIFRAGGDEFVILCAGINESKMNEQVAQLKGMAKNTYDVSFAIGSVYLEGNYDIDAAIKAADERMYQDKKAFYENLFKN